MHDLICYFIISLVEGNKDVEAMNSIVFVNSINLWRVHRNTPQIKTKPLLRISMKSCPNSQWHSKARQIKLNPMQRILSYHCTLLISNQVSHVKPIWPNFQHPSTYLKHYNYYETRALLNPSCYSGTLAQFVTVYFQTNTYTVTLPLASHTSHRNYFRARQIPTHCGHGLLKTRIKGAVHYLIHLTLTVAQVNLGKPSMPSARKGKHDTNHIQLHN